MATRAQEAAIRALEEAVAQLEKEVERQQTLAEMAESEDQRKLATTAGEELKARAMAVAKVLAGMKGCPEDRGFQAARLIATRDARDCNSLAREPR